MPVDIHTSSCNNLAFDDIPFRVYFIGTYFDKGGLNRAICISVGPFFSTFHLIRKVDNAFCLFKM